MRIHRLYKFFHTFLVLILLVFRMVQVQGQIPLIDTFQTSIDFTDGLIDAQWNTTEAHQLLSLTGDTYPEESDLSGYWKAGYNPENQLFYVLIEVKDDTITNGELMPSDSLYNADHVTVYFDLYNDGFSSYNDADFAFLLFPETDQYKGRAGQISFDMGDYDYIESIDKGTTAEGWFVEMLFSFRDLLNKQEVLFIDTIGFEAVITDNDKGTGERDYRLSWNDPDVIAWANPSAMRDIILDQKLNATFKPVCSAGFNYEIISDNGEGRVQVSFSDQSATNDEIINWSWELGDDSYSLAQNPVHTYDPFTEGTNACLYITTKYGCNNSLCKSVYLPPDQYSLKGKVKGTFNGSFGWKVVAFQEQSSGYQAVESYSLNSEDFEFTSLVEGNCILYALPKEVDDNYFPTYFVNKCHWQQCDIIMVNGDVYDVDIQLNDYSFDIPGAGTITGSLEQLPGGIPIVLEGENGHKLSYTLTNASGEFSFQQLPYGTYVVYPEYPGMDNSGTSIQLSAEQPDWSIIQQSDRFMGLPVTQSGYRIDYNRQQQELIITRVDGQSGKTKIDIFDMLGELVYSHQSGSFESITIYTGTLNTGILFIKVWNGRTLYTEKILK